MSLINILIPLAFGLYLIFFPGSFTKAKGEAVPGAKRRLRVIGYLLLAVAAISALVEYGQRIGPP